jgi:invasion protein IalB
MMSNGIKWGKSFVAHAAVLAMIAGVGTSEAFAKKEAAKPASNEWVKVCRKSNDDKKVDVCSTRTDVLHAVSGANFTPLMVLSIGKKQEVAIVNLPHTWSIARKMKDKKTGKDVMVTAPASANWVMPAGAYVKIDKNKPHKLTYTACNNFGCLAETKLTAELKKELKSGDKVVVYGINKKTPLGSTLSLKGLGKAYDGKSITAAQYNEKIKKKMEKLYKMAAKNRKAMEAKAKGK